MGFLSLLIVSVAITSLILSSSLTSFDVFGQKEKYRAKLSGKSEVPRVNSTAKGSANFKSQKDILTWKLNITEMSDATGAKIYIGNKTENGEPIIDLMKSNNWSRTPLGIVMNGSISASDLQGSLQGNSTEVLKSIMSSGDTYVNVLTNNHPEGEVRGQIKLSAPKLNQTNTANMTGNITTVAK
jgi:hypothetical protein